MHCYVDLTISIFSFILLIVLVYVLILEILKYTYRRRNKVNKIQNIMDKRNQQMDSGRMLSDFDPYYFQDVKESEINKDQRRCCSDCKYMLKTSFRFYFFSSLIFLNIVCFLDDGFTYQHYSVEFIVIMRVCITIIGTILF